MSTPIGIFICPDNFGVIQSEKPDFDLAEIQTFLEEQEGGFFIRDPESPAFDCKYMPFIVFAQIYTILPYTDTPLFLQLRRI